MEVNCEIMRGGTVLVFIREKFCLKLLKINVV